MLEKFLIKFCIAYIKIFNQIEKIQFWSLKGLRTRVVFKASPLLLGTVMFQSCCPPHGVFGRLLEAGMVRLGSTSELRDGQTPHAGIMVCSRAMEHWSWRARESPTLLPLHSSGCNNKPEHC